MSIARLTKSVLLTVFVFACSSSAYGGTITGVSVFDFSSEFPVFGRVAENTVNGSELFGDLHRATRGPGMWHTEFGDFDPSQNNFAHITFDLGASYDIDEIKVWNYGETITGGGGFTRRGVSDLRVSVASSSSGSTFTPVGDFTLSRAPLFRDPSGDFFFGAESLSVVAQDVRLVRFDILGSHWNLGRVDVVGLSEVRFSGSITGGPGINAVPEPSSALVLGICVALGLVPRSRRKKTSSKH